jgi:excisionase family DNA binding protein
MVDPERRGRLLTVVEVAELYGYQKRYILELVRRHRIPVLGTGRMIRFDRVALDALEEALRFRSPSPAANRPAPSPSPGASPDAAFNAALKRLTRDSPKKKPHSSKPSSCAPNTTENAVASDPLPKQ